MSNKIRLILFFIILLVNNNGHTNNRGEELFAIDDQFTIPENTTPSVVIFVLTNDSGINKATTIVAVTQPTNGTIVNNGNFISYLPDTDYCNSISGSTDDFMYSISDTPPAIESSATVRVTVECSGIPAPPMPQIVPATSWYSLMFIIFLLVFFVYRKKSDLYK